MADERAEIEALVRKIVTRTLGAPANGPKRPLLDEATLRETPTGATLTLAPERPRAGQTHRLHQRWAVSWRRPIWDACAAAILVGFLLKWEPARTTELANRLGAFVASRPGATPELPADLVDEVTVD